MKHQTYVTLYQAHLGNVNKKALTKARSEETDPFYHNLIDLLLQEKFIMVPWNVSTFTNEFRLGTPQERLDETVIAFILRLAIINKEERYFRAFKKPETYDAIMVWDMLLNRIILCSMALLYNVRWDERSGFVLLQSTIIQLLHHGDAYALRELMKSLGISLARDTPYQSELEFGKLNFLHVGQYGSFYWRYLHWMAEAFTLRKDKKMDFYKEMWVDIVNETLYRTLRCGICMYHFRKMIEELKPQLTNKETDFPKLWYDIHNRVHAQRREQYPSLNEPDYSESEFEEDRKFMRRALVP